MKLPKNLKYELSNHKRVHINDSYVLIFRYEKPNNIGKI